MPGGTAIAGIGATEFSKDSGRSELRLAVEAITAALADAGLAAADVDGLVTFTMDGNAEIAIARELGLRELRFLDQIGYGGGAACATVQHAAMAVATGTADVVVCYRALNERSGRRFGQVAAGLAGAATTAGIDNGWHYPMGLATPAATVAMVARRYMHEYGATSEDFGRVTVAARRHAANNPNAWFYQRPITLAEHQESRWVAEPLRLLDCCQESDGAVAIVVTSLDRARDLLRRPAVIAAAAQGSGPGQYIMTSYYRDDLAALPEMAVVARQLWRQAGIAPADVRAAMLYDHFTPYVLIQLEELGFCPRGEARNFISGGAIELGGRLPLNTHGGQLGEAYIHGMNGIAEAVRQVRGTSVNQVPGDGPVLVTAGTGVPTSGLILSLSLPARGPGSGALQVLERRGQAERLVQDQRAVVHGVDHIAAAGPVKPVLLDFADPRPVLIEMDDEIAGNPGCRIQDALGRRVSFEGGLRGDLDEELDVVAYGIHVVAFAVPHHHVRVADRCHRRHPGQLRGTHRR
jgi:acetyl-CoA acetyltransferase